MTIRQDLRRMQWIAQHFEALCWNRADITYWVDRLLMRLETLGVLDTANFTYTRKTRRAT